ncbi:hypothetical protein NZD88_12380 [Chryseobacterium antibioticum]|uniref:DUF5105 domain-containing protein n=1 Tax=Chryseobacterium pyrolae TaxID=2987481 RepID=A0ABT2IIA9_9FLAO|nr:hypothetical protein [Chryseobacterium pyrolae]MCT2408339.1 hypothetical protein [Chryseobacterium pyrolae]
MKGPVRILFLLLLFSIQSLSAQTKALNPEQVFGMYFDAFVKQDENTLHKLNAYLSPFLGAENTYTIDLKRSNNEEVNNLTNVFLTNLSKETAAVCKTEAGAYFDALLSNLKKTRYVVKEIKEVKNEYADNSLVTELNVDLHFSVPAKIPELKLEDAKTMKAEELKNYLKNKTEAFTKSEKKVTVKQVFKLYQIKKEGRTYYWNGGPQELVWKLNELYFKNLNH